MLTREWVLNSDLLTLRHGRQYIGSQVVGVLNLVHFLRYFQRSVVAQPASS